MEIYDKRIRITECLWYMVPQLWQALGVVDFGFITAQSSTGGLRYSWQGHLILIELKGGVGELRTLLLHIHYSFRILSRCGAMWWEALGG